MPAFCPNLRPSSRPLRICLLTYRGNPRSGGQGVYVRLLSQALRDLGHEVEVWSGQPYPELVEGVHLLKVPSLDLWNADHLLEMPAARELLDPINLAEYASSRLGAFAEPISFSRRVARNFQRFGNQRRYDIVHDNQSLGPGLLSIRKRTPVVATIHHPITVDRRIAYEAARTKGQRFGLRRWYSFVDAQLKVSRELDRILTVSQAASEDLQREYELPRKNIRVVGNGINLDVFRPMPEILRIPEQLITTLSADSPLKGFRYLLEALALLRTKRPKMRLKVIGSPGHETGTDERVKRLGLGDIIEFTGRVENEDIVRAYAKSSLAVIPSLYEGFGFPAGEAMASEVAVLSSRGGALPEVVGEDGACGMLVPPQNGAALAHGIDSLLDQPARRLAMGKAGRERVLREFTWQRAAERTVDAYREAIAEHRPTC
ncbi:MAG TPA: glycosyltransferase family 4 protein [Polyangiales bacterium]|nr:glycosyltransferase family 4 protein [Polyangiales bacterium]